MESLMGDGVPRLGFCGFSGSGKTTIIEKVAPRLMGMGLSIGYLKHDAHGLKVDHEGKDTSRIFNSGVAAIAANSPDELFVRKRAGEGAPAMAEVFDECDLVLVEGYKDAPWDKIWVHPFSGGKDAIDVKNVIYEIGGGATLKHGDIEQITAQVAWWLIRKQLLKPVYGGILIGGKSVRMGRPKTLLPAGGHTLVERAYDIIKGRCSRVVLLGNAPLPDSMGGAERLLDPAGLEGPLAGLVAAHRYARFADWIIMAVDLPNADNQFVGKLLKRTPAFRFIGAQSPNGEPEPLCALYSSQLLAKLERSFSGDFSITRFLKRQGIKGDPALWDPVALKNVNVPSDIT